MDYTKLENKQRCLKGFLNKEHLYKQNYLDYINVKFTYHSNALEGNTLTEIETALIIEKGITVGGKSINEHHEALNHYKAFNYLFQLIQDNESPFVEQDILNIHAIILDNINNKYRYIYRYSNVRILGSNIIFPN
ncbi:Fic family N-terminal domain protein [Candidatus Hepatincolaceae symbiont of Richtersius coronifer]